MEGVCKADRGSSNPTNDGLRMAYTSALEALPPVLLITTELSLDEKLDPLDLLLELLELSDEELDRTEMVGPVPLPPVSDIPRSATGILREPGPEARCLSDGVVVRPTPRG